MGILYETVVREFSLGSQSHVLSLLISDAEEHDRRCTCRNRPRLLKRTMHIVESLQSFFGNRAAVVETWNCSEGLRSPRAACGLHRHIDTNYQQAPITVPADVPIRSDNASMI